MSNIDTETAVNIIKEEFPFIKFKYKASEHNHWDKGYYYDEYPYNIFIHHQFIILTNHGIKSQFHSIDNLIENIYEFFPKEFYIQHLRDKKINTLLNV